jgi:hypothetical protein
MRLVREFGTGNTASGKLSAASHRAGSTFGLMAARGTSSCPRSHWPDI